MLLKLFALRDQIDNEAKEFGRHHAFDIYSTWAMMTEEEFQQAEQLRADYSKVAVLIEAIEIARNLFKDENAMGVVRLKEHVQRESLQLLELANFISDIRTLFLYKNSSKYHFDTSFQIKNPTIPIPAVITTVLKVVL